ncbi:MAG: sigma 54-interacting transcriptional regulator [Deltaproteobacteria bacterium]|nr:sigma 54-interacting transcriptional regulator [Deltaproteobacteria bacterium]
MTVLWHHFLGASKTYAEEIAARLQVEGLEVQAWHPELEGSVGVVFLGSELQETCQFLRDAQGDGTTRVVAVAVGEALPADGWRLLRAGACDLLHLACADSSLATVLARVQRILDLDRLMGSRLVREHVIGRSPSWTRMLRQLVEVARFTQASVLIEGESGTGKELLARLLHTLDPRTDKRDIVLMDCTTLVRDLSGSEFFGHERGAYTGAVGAREGVFAMADGGTLFLDEVGELPLELQAQLLRAIQERTYKRVGGNAWHRVNFRLVCATNRDLLQAVERGEFRRDLYYRIAGWRCAPPPLRERIEDIIPLAEHFLAAALPEGRPVGFAPLVRDHLVRRMYPGNVRDLRQLVHRMVCRHVGDGPISPGSLPSEEWPESADAEGWADEAFEGAVRRAVVQGASLKAISRAASELAVRVALQEAGGNLQRAAKTLGVTDRALQLRRASRRADLDTIDA